MSILNISPSLGMIAGLVDGLQALSELRGGTLDVRRYGHTSTNVIGGGKTEFEMAVEVHHVLNQISRRCVLYFESIDLARNPDHLVELYESEGYRPEVCIFGELFSFDRQAPLTAQLAVGRYLAAVAHTWVYDGHNRSEGAVRAHINSLVADGAAPF
jgi:hypothetical protein